MKKKKRVIVISANGLTEFYRRLWGDHFFSPYEYECEWVRIICVQNKKKTFRNGMTPKIDSGNNEFVWLEMLANMKNERASE